MSDNAQGGSTAKERRGGIRKIITYSLIILTILFPTLLAVLNVIYTNGELSGSRSSATIVELYDIDDKLLYSENSDYRYEREDSLVAIFTAIYNNLQKCPPVSENILTATPLKVRLSLGNTHTVLTCHFSFTSAGSYCYDESGQYYTIPTVYSEYFLNSYFAEILYDEATIPRLYTADGDTIISKNTVWKYKSLDGSTKTAKLLNDTSEIRLYNTTGSIALEFDNEPDYCLVRIYENGIMIFEGSLGELPFVTLDSSTTLDMTVRAVWDHENGRQGYGEINYDFNVMIHNRATFEISDSKMSRGEFILLSANNVADASKLIFSSPDTALTPRFYVSGDTAYSLLPYPKDCLSDKMVFTLSYGVSGRTFTVELDTASTPTANLSDMAFGVFDLDISAMKYNNSEHVFLSGSSLTPTEQGFSQVTSFGEHVKFGSYPLISILTEYACDSYGAFIGACFGGKVTLTGESPIIGKYAVIDSGMGLKLWYCGLGAIDLKEGDYAAVGDSVGKTSSLSTGRGEGFSLIVTCYDSLLSTEVIFDDIYNTN